MSPLSVFWLISFNADVNFIRMNTKLITACPCKYNEAIYPEF